MKKKILVLFLLVFSFKVNAQMYLGYSFLQIKNALEKKHHVVKVNYTYEGVKHIYDKNDHIAYYFNDNDACIKTVIMYQNHEKGAINRQIEYYNDVLRVVSKTKWSYTKGDYEYEIVMITDDSFTEFIWRFKL
jgi:hypothetical protein